MPPRACLRSKQRIIPTAAVFGVVFPSSAGTAAGAHLRCGERAKVAMRSEDSYSSMLQYNHGWHAAALAARHARAAHLRTTCTCCFSFFRGTPKSGIRGHMRTGMQKAHTPLLAHKLREGLVARAPTWACRHARRHRLGTCGWVGQRQAWLCRLCVCAEMCGQPMCGAHLCERHACVGDKSMPWARAQVWRRAACVFGTLRSCPPDTPQRPSCLLPLTRASTTSRRAART